MSFSLVDFRQLEPREITKIIERQADKLKMEHRLGYIATLNAIGNMFVENYTYIDAFDKEANELSKSNETYTDEEQQELYEYFSTW